MKKIFFAFAIVLSLSLCAYSQKSDGFFNSIDGGTRTGGLDNIDMPAIPNHNYYDETGDLPNSPSAEAPLGTGLFLLTALGAGYAISKRRKEER